jgi:hypothetical protein
MQMMSIQLEKYEAAQYEQDYQYQYFTPSFINEQSV